MLIPGAGPALEQPGAMDRSGGEDLRGVTGLLFVADRKAGPDLAELISAAQGDGRSAEATPSHAGTEHATFETDSVGEFDHEIEFRAGDLEIVAQ